jgi:tRNA U38,U39,U40 pseudouridine synthase TruA
VIPENPSVAFQCSGAPDICSALRAAVDDALEKAGFSSVRSAARADIGVSARAEVTQERVDQQFKTSFAVRSYAIDLTAETTRSGEAVSMPGATTLSFDPQFGAERAAEKSRLIASEVVDRIKAFVKRKRGG